MVGKRNDPAVLLVVSRERPRAVSVRTILAPGTAAPLASRTVPLTAALPSVAWPYIVAALKQRTRKMRVGVVKADESYHNGGCWMLGFGKAGVCGSGFRIGGWGS